MRKTLLSGTLFLLLGGGVAAGFLTDRFFDFMDTPLAAPVELTIDSGWGVHQAARALEKEGVVTSARWFSLLARFYGEGYIQAGEYRFPAGETPLDHLERLREGKVVSHRLTLPEGFSVREVGQVLEQRGWSGALAFLEDPESPKKLGLDAPSLEGWLFPETYFFKKGDTAQQLIARMVAMTRVVLDEEWRGREKGITLTPYDGLILASIIEKETGNGNERQRISGVFHNRLKKRMLLQSDPTVIYGIPNFDGNITRKHLRTPTPFNTYTSRGLPPTPICNSGRAAIHAAFHPQKSNELFFVARSDGSGTHVFSRTLAAHERNVDRYQRHRKKSK
ncbi:MAG: endolytic transglycosylase MltG [Magnetococcales bacterium]|nr:endolytic transglycosylase MltG [Magnetococcales bacterium]